LIYNYPGLSAVDMERRIVLITERAYSFSVNDIQHIESESIEGLGLERVYFQPGTDIGWAIAQLTATSGTVATLLPRGTEPPSILRTTPPTFRLPSSTYTATPVRPAVV
jgi:multidrug efflux pump subunit AcrB